MQFPAREARCGGATTCGERAGDGRVGISRFIKEQGTQSLPEYRCRVVHLALIYSGIVVTGNIAIVLLVVRGKFFVTRSRRSNVETLTIAFIIVLFAYLSVLSLPGTWGALRILYFNAPTRLGRDTATVEARKQAALTPLRGAHADRGPQPPRLPRRSTR